MNIFQKAVLSAFKLNQQVKEALGEGIYTILGIMAFSLVGCGLLTGVLGRGWVGAWILVIIGMLLSFLPVLNYFHTRAENFHTSAEKEDNKDSATLFSPEPEEPLRSEIYQRPFSAKKNSSVDEATIRAVEFEAALARKRLAERERARQEKAKKEEEERLREEARQATRAYQKQVYERQKAYEKAERQRRSQQSFNGDYFKQKQFQDSSRTQASGVFFKGVTNSTELRKRYLDLLKIYHPDNVAGDSDITRSIQKEYQELQTFFAASEKHLKQ